MFSKYRTFFLLAIVAIIICSSEDLESFIEMVLENLAIIASYVPNTDNEELVNLTDTSVISVNKTFDFIIIGAGAAGCVLAKRLSEIKKWNVLVLEAGGEQNEFSDIPGMAAYLQGSEMNWGYYTIPQNTCCLGMINNTCSAPRGKVIGGSSTINAKIYVRGNPDDFDAWAALGNEGWSFKEVFPYFLKSENTHIYNPDEGYHGTKGELDVSYTEPTTFTDIYLEGMAELGLDTIDYNGETQIGASPGQFMQRGNKSVGGARAFIDPIRNRTNLNITLDAFVTRVLINNDTNFAYGVEFVKDGKKYVVNASKEVIVAAGAFNTPQILMLSGIGPKEHLEDLGIDVVLDLPVGKYMQDHVEFNGVVFHTNITLFNESVEVLLQEYVENHRPYTACYNIDSLAFFNVSDNSSSVPNIQHMMSVPPGFDTEGTFLNFRDELREVFTNNYHRYSDLFMGVILLHPKSKGNVTLKSNNIEDFPNINFNYFSDKDGEDIEIMYQGILKTLELLDTESFKSVNSSLAPVISGCDDYETFSRDYWYCAIRRFCVTVYHPVGTARMGTSPNESVVSTDLLVHGMKNLRVVDASVFPEITSGNTVAPTYMVAEKISDEIKHYYSVKVSEKYSKGC